jgi:predicted DsbA family dithiol-disulfide isomerase
MAVQLAQKMAVESDMVRADMVEGTEFPHLVVNEEVHIEGAQPEPLFLAQVMRAAAKG